MAMKIINIADVEGFKLGNAENKEKATGCTVIVAEEGAVGGVDVRGGGPATRETDLLRSENTVNTVNAVVLSGGSAFGLEAASGVMRALADREVGFDVGGGLHVPIVCGASLFDLAVGDPKAFPDVNMGIQAVRNAYDGKFTHGNHGAGTGATVGKIKGFDRAMKAGLGAFACGDDFVQVGAIAAVNAVGDVYNGPGNIIAGLRSEDGQSIYGTIKTLQSMVHDQTALVDDRTAFINRADIEAALAAAAAERLKESEEEIKEPESVDAEIKEPAGYDALEAAAAEQMIPEPVVIELSADDEPEAAEEPEPEIIEEPVAVPVIEEELPELESEPKIIEEPVTQPAVEEVISEPEPDIVELSREEMGYGITFNTTIACLITNAALTKSQANKLASILHDAYARSIKPVHGTLDGDTVFVLSTGKQQVNFDAFAALATDVMQYAIIDGALSADGAYGLPAAKDMKKAKNHE